MRIKERDEWKRVFIIYVESFEPMVMFFRMTNLLAIFQAIMNQILRDIINKGKVVAFVDDMSVGTEIKEEYNEIVEEVLKRLKEKDLYIKPEKYIWKVRKIRFLEVVIEPNKIEMEKKKVNRVLSWLEPKNVKDIRKFLDLVNYYKRFIKDFAQITRPINVLTRKDVKWQ